MSAQEYALRRIYDGIREDNDFADYDQFLEWAQGKYRVGHMIYKLDQAKSYSPENSYWYYRTKELPTIESPFCTGCQRVCPITKGGCDGYRSYFVKNWNENICRRPKPKEPTKVEVFRYEHPDMEREGIVWTT